PGASSLPPPARATLSAAFDDLLLFPPRHYAEVQAVPFGSFATPWADTASVAFFPLTFVLAGATVAITRGAIRHDPRFRASLALAIVGLLGAYPRPDIFHINTTVPLAGPLFALDATHLLGRLARHARIVLRALSIALCLAAIGYAITLRMAVMPGPLHPVPTPPA